MQIDPYDLVDSDLLPTLRQLPAMDPLPRCECGGLSRRSWSQPRNSRPGSFPAVTVLRKCDWLL
jgi:hypothetical protein